MSRNYFLSWKRKGSIIMSLNGLIFSFLENEEDYHYHAIKRSRDAHRPVIQHGFGLRHITDPRHCFFSTPCHFLRPSLYIPGRVIYLRAGCACDLGLWIWRLGDGDSDGKKRTRSSSMGTRRMMVSIQGEHDIGYTDEEGVMR